MKFQFLVRPEDDETFERLNGFVEGDSLPRIGETQRFYWPNGGADGKVVDVQHAYGQTREVDREQGPLVVISMARALFDGMVDAYARRSGWHFTDDAL